MAAPHWLRPSLLAVVVGGLGSPVAAQPAPAHEQDRLVGTWRLIVEKSTYSPGPAPVSETRTYLREDGALLGTIRREFADGRRERIEYTADFDREYPVVGTDAYDHVRLKRIDAYTAEAVLSHAGRVFGTARRVIALDGQSMTITFRRDGTAGPGVHNVAHYEKIAP